MAKPTDITKSNQLTKSALALLPTPCPFEILVKEWLEYGRVEGLSDKTLTGYHETINKFRWWWLNVERGNPHPRAVTVDNARRFAAYLRDSRAERWGDPVKPGKEQLSPASVASYGRTVKVFFSWLESQSYIGSNPFATKQVKFTVRKAGEQPLKTLTSAELETIIRVAASPERLMTYHGLRDYAMLLFLIDTGCRKGELMSIELGKFDLDNKRVEVSGKTGKRVISFTANCKPALLQYLRDRRIGQNSKPTSKLWLDEWGQPLGLEGFSSFIRRLSRDSGVKFHAHMLRHTYATHAAEHVPLSDVKGLLGHTNIATTQRYVHKSNERLRSMAEQVSPLADLNPAGIARKAKRRGRPLAKPE